MIDVAEILFNTQLKIFFCTFGAKVPKRGGFDSPAPLNDKDFALDPFRRQ